MNREELIVAIAEKANMPLNTTKKIISAAFDVVGETLASGESIFIFRFGKFQPVRRRERQIRRAFDGQLSTVPEHTVVRFKAHNSLRDKVKNAIPKENPHQADDGDDEE